MNCQHLENVTHAWKIEVNPFLSTQMVCAEMSPCPFLPAHSIGWSQEWKKHSYLLNLNSTLQGKGQKNLREPELTVSRDTCVLLKTVCSTPGCIPGSQLRKGGWLYFPTHVLKLLSIPKLPCSFQIGWKKMHEIPVIDLHTRKRGNRQQHGVLSEHKASRNIRTMAFHS